MKLIACVDKNWGIGKDNHLLFDLPSDLEFFRKTTYGKTIIMGRKTLESLPNGQPLPDRENIVISRDTNINNVLQQCINKDTYVIGGGEIFKLFLPYCDIALITKVNADGHADTFCPNLDTMKDWKLVSTSPAKFENDLQFNYCKYENM